MIDNNDSGTNGTATLYVTRNWWVDVSAFREATRAVDNAARSMRNMGAMVESVTRYLDGLFGLPHGDEDDRPTAIRLNFANPRRFWTKRQEHQIYRYQAVQNRKRYVRTAHRRYPNVPRMSISH